VRKRTKGAGRFFGEGVGDAHGFAEKLFESTTSTRVRFGITEGGEERPAVYRSLEMALSPREANWDGVHSIYPIVADTLGVGQAIRLGCM